MKTLVLVDHEGGAIKDATLATVAAASQLGEVHLLVAGKGVDGVAQAAVDRAVGERRRGGTRAPPPPAGSSRRPR